MLNRSELLSLGVKLDEYTAACARDGVAFEHYPVQEMAAVPNTELGPDPPLALFV